MSDEHPVRGQVDACSWSYERSWSEGEPTQTIVFARLTLTGAIYDLTNKKVTQATVGFGTLQPAAVLGKLKGKGPHRLSITLPVEDLPAFAAVIMGPRPLHAESVVYGGDNSVVDFKLVSDSF